MFKKNIEYFLGINSIQIIPAWKYYLDTKDIL